jgi:predicted nucleic acid-binding protein
MAPQVVLDTNVLFSALYSRLGSSFVILNQVSAGRFGVHLSVPLLLQYEDVLKRRADALGLDLPDIEIFIDRVCAVADFHEIHYLWRPFLSDRKDDLVLELAVAARCSHIVTHNVRDFRGAESFGIKVLSPVEFRRTLGDEL